MSVLIITYIQIICVRKLKHKNFTDFFVNISYNNKSIRIYYNILMPNSSENFQDKKSKCLLKQFFL